MYENFNALVDKILCTSKIHKLRKYIYNEYVHKFTDRADTSKLFNIYLLNKIILQKYIFNISLPNKEKTTASFFYL